MKKVLEKLRFVAYLTLVIVDGIITVMSMCSLGHNPWVSAGLGIIGAVIVLLGTWLFLSGIRKKGVDRAIRLGTWVLSVVIIVSLNWAFTRQNVSSQSESVEQTAKAERFDEETRQRDIMATQKQINTLIDKLSVLNQWQEKERASVTDAIERAKTALEALKRPVARTQDVVQSISVFKKMGSPLQWAEENTADLWWILSFLALQLFTVLAAPKGEEDEPAAPVRKERVARAPFDWSEWVEKFVWANWISVRNPNRTPPYKILPRNVFDQFIKGHWRVFSDARYHAIIKAAVAAGVIEGDEIREEKEPEAVKKVLDIIVRK